jgi:hypothetical protein
MPALEPAMRKLGGKPVSETNAEAQATYFLLFARRVNAHLSDDETAKMGHPNLDVGHPA